ncbi:SRPBCC family protein [Calidifontibacter indicus]|uniref:Carbon monoxide dehydrogenase subunit G n=1 Tax=Calidifontibacter indicus TaxID=419650 RepID=A0A3D9UZ84_9MICO|nr:SRPBCC family protein [Calidifontibacter indicus]REF31274.1 carbon monoxide dehydrogenase subunit G [Calidifontibacter indicus]
MDLKHSFTVPADAERTWATLTDLEGVAGCFPGATITSAEGDHFEGTVKVKLGPIALVYAGSGDFVERDDAAHTAVIDAKGKDKRGNGTAGATVHLSLQPQGDSTKVDVVTDLKVTGKPAQFGRGVMQDVSDKLLQQFVACLESRLSQPADEPVSTADTTPVEATPEAASAEAPAAAPAPAPSPPAAAPASKPAPALRVAQPVADDSIDLGGLVGPTLLKAYLPQLLSAAVGVALGYVIGRRSGS